jgi:hypothetical protein
MRDLAQAWHYRLAGAEWPMDKRLEEQLERVRQLSARVAQIHEQLAHNTELLMREHSPQARSPLHEIRDLRTWSQDHGDEDAPERNRRPVQSRADDRSRSRRRRGK